MISAMTYHKRMKIMFIVCILLIIIMSLIVSTGLSESRHKTYTPDNSGIGNPLMGYAPCAWLNPQSITDDVHLLYMDITWREWEPQRGEYAIEDVIINNQLQHWRQEGKHVVLRFICDMPGSEDHLDVPDWLYEEIDGDGTHYNMEYGKGFSPNYSNEKLIQYHAQAIHALGEAFGRDTFISYVQLGSLGHWGEWHVNYSAGIDRLPLSDVRERYIQPYIDAFPHAHIMMRRPFETAAEHNFGLFNDMTGHLSSTQEWLAWIEQGGNFTQTQEKNGLVSMPEFWQTAPSGGEFTSSLSMKTLLSDDLRQTLDLLRQSHTTFIGPKIAENSYRKGYKAVLQSIGYRLHISEAQLTRQSNGALLGMTWENHGIAPMYFDWPVQVCVWDKSGSIVEITDVPLILSELLPGTSVHCEVSLDTEIMTKRGSGKYTIAIGIMDPMTGEYAVRIDTKAKRHDGMLILFD